MRVVVVSKPEDVPTKAVDGKTTLVYWNITGLVQPIRLALVLAGVDFVDVRIDGGDPTASLYKQAWFAAKPGTASVLAFPNLPYYMEGNDGDGDGALNLTQSNTILRQVGRKYNLMGVAGQEHIVDLAIDQLSDFEKAFSGYAYAKGEDAVTAWFEGRGPKIVKQLTLLLGTRDYLTGDIVSVADIKLYDLLYKLSIIETELSQKKVMNESMTSFMGRIENLERIKEYMASPNYQKRPLNSSQAKWK